MAASTTYEYLVKEVASKNNEIAGKIDELATLRFLPLVYYSAFLIYRNSSKVLKLINKVEESGQCFSCESENTCTIELRNHLDFMIPKIKTLLRIEKGRVPSFFIARQERILEELENKSENYWISSDSELKELCTTLSQKIKQKHAIR